MDNPVIITKRNTDRDGNPISIKLIETKQIYNSVVVLKQSPDEVESVFIRGYKEVFDIEKIKNNEFKVDYSQGVVYFNPKSEGKSVTLEYYGTGYELISASRIFTKYDKYGNAIETLEEVMDDVYKIKPTLDRLSKDEELINQLHTDVEEGKVLQPLLHNDVIQGRQTKEELEQTISDAQEDINTINATNNDIKYITKNQWVLNSTSGMYEYTLPHTMNSKALTINCYYTDTDEFAFIGGKIIDKNNILFKNEEAVNLTVVLNSRYYKPQVTLTSEITEEVVEARKGKVNLKTKIDEIDNGLVKVNEDLDNMAKWWKPKTQIPHDNMNFEDVINNYYEPLRTKYFREISREEIGKDQSGNYPFWLYTFTPKGYEKTIILSAGVHPDEVHAFICLARFLKAVYEEWETHESLAYIRWNVRLIVMPFMNPWGGMQNPLSKTNSRNVEINRNYGYMWRECTQVYHGTKGTAPFSEIETQHIRTIIDKYKDESECWIDLHTSAPGGNWEEKHVDIAVSDSNFRASLDNTIVDKTQDYFRYRFSDISLTCGKFSNHYSNSQNWGNFSKNLYTIVPESNHNMFGDKRYSSEAMNFYVEYYGNIIIQQVLKNVEFNVNSNNSVIRNLKAPSGKTTDLLDYDWNSNDIYSKYDALMSKYPSYITKTKIGETTDENLHIYKYEFSNGNPTKTIFLSSNVGGKEIKAMLVTYQTLKYLCENFDKNEKLTDLYLNYKIVVIPSVNLYGLNYGSNCGERIYKCANGSNVGEYSTDNNEHLMIKSIINDNDFDMWVDVYSRERTNGFKDGDSNFRYVVSDSTINLKNLKLYLELEKKYNNLTNETATLYEGSTDSTLAQIALKNKKGVTLVIQYNKNYIYKDCEDSYNTLEIAKSVEMLLNTIISI